MATPEHRFYVRAHRARDGLGAEGEDGGEAGEWVAAGELRPSDEVLRADGAWATVTGVEAEGRGAAVYNFEVEDNHNYFVGTQGALVHNTCVKPSEIAAIASKFAIGQCDSCAQAVAKFIKSRGGSGEILTLTGDGLMMSKSANVRVATQGYHQGVLYQGMVYDNVHRNGSPLTEWLDDFIYHGQKAGGLVETTATVTRRQSF